MVISIILCLVKIVYLGRVFKNFNFLVTIMIKVIEELYFFLLLFMIFLVAFAECYHILEADVSTYGRTPEFVAHLITCLRVAAGDFAYLDRKTTLDTVDDVQDDGTIIWRHS